jgi:hypothetical protein
MLAGIEESFFPFGHWIRRIGRRPNHDAEVTRQSKELMMMSQLKTGLKVMGINARGLPGIVSLPSFTRG